MFRRTVLPVALLAAALAVGPAAAQMSYGKAPRLNKEPDLPAGVGVEQKLGAQVPLDLVFHDHDGKPVRLGDCVGGKPTILVLAYYACPKLCTEVLNGLVRELKALNRIGLSAGRDFNVVTVSINPKDAPAFARMKRLSYLEEYDRRPENEPGWWFLTASRGQGTDVLAGYDQVKALANAVGFNYAADNQKQYDDAAAEPDETKRRVLLEKAVRRTKDYTHPSVVMVLTPAGQLSQYHLGLAPVDYTAEDVRRSLTAASDGKMGSVATRAALLCFAYDSAEGHYRPVMTAMGLAAAPFPFIIAGIVYFAWRRARREKPVGPAERAAGAGGRYTALGTGGGR
jgi:protein SCO1/2